MNRLFVLRFIEAAAGVALLWFTINTIIVIVAMIYNRMMQHKPGKSKQSSVDNA